MTTRLAHRLTSFMLAFAVTFAVAGGIDHLAASEQVSAQWAAGLTCPSA